MPPREAGIVITSAPRADGALSVVCVEWQTKRIVLSSGEEVYTPYEKLLMLAEQVCQEQAPISIRLWTTRDGEELIWLHRDGERSTASSLVTTLRPETVF